MKSPYPPDLVEAEIGGQVVALVPRHRAEAARSELAAELRQAPADLRTAPDQPTSDDVALDEAQLHDDQVVPRTRPERLACRYCGKRFWPCQVREHVRFCPMAPIAISQAAERGELRLEELAVPLPPAVQALAGAPLAQALAETSPAPEPPAPVAPVPAPATVGVPHPVLVASSPSSATAPPTPSSARSTSPTATRTRKQRTAGAAATPTAPPRPTPRAEADDLDDQDDPELASELERLEQNDPVRAYFRQIGQTQLLSYEEEQALARQMEAGRAAEAQFRDGVGHDPQQRQVLERQIADGAQASEQLTTANLRLVVSIAKRYQGRGLTLLDLIQEGNIGLMRAVERFDYRKRLKFSTYATWWVRQGITRALADQARTIRLPVHLHEAVVQVRRCAIRLHQELGREPLPSEIGIALGRPTAKVERVLAAASRIVSLDRPAVPTEPETALAMQVPDESPPVEDVAEQRLLREALEQAMEGLEERERKVLVLRYGLNDGRYRTLEEVGEAFGITRERIRQIEVEALRKMRHPALGRGLAAFLV